MVFQFRSQGPLSWSYMLMEQAQKYIVANQKAERLHAASTKMLK